VTTFADECIHPFRIDIRQDELNDLRERLDHTRWPDELPAAGGAYSVPRDYLKELMAYWRHRYDWRAAETSLNRWPQFTTTIEGRISISLTSARRNRMRPRWS
jgi:epoxide hydrolase